MKQLKLLSPDFFISKFGLPVSVEALRYGLKKVGKKVAPIILVENDDSLFFIDILEDCLAPSELPCLDIVWEEVLFSENDEWFIFKGKTLEACLSRIDVEEFYASRYYSEKTLEYLGV